MEKDGFEDHVDGQAYQAGYSAQELAKIRDTHREDTGETKTNIDELKNLADATISTALHSSASACEREHWRQDILKQKIANGMIHPRGALKLAISDVGLGLLCKARTYYAMHPEKECKSTALQKGIKYLFPYRKTSIGTGTCAGHERDVVEVTIAQEVNSIQTPPSTSNCPSNGAASSIDYSNIDNSDNLDVDEDQMKY